MLFCKGVLRDAVILLLAHHFLCPSWYFHLVTVVVCDWGRMFIKYWK